VVCLLLFAYIGAVTGASKGDLLNLSALGGLFGAEADGRSNQKILDTSVIIDGRIADVARRDFWMARWWCRSSCSTSCRWWRFGGLDEAQPRAARLDILQRLQKMTHLKVQIVDEDFPNVPEVDMKLIELAKVRKCKSSPTTST